MFFFFGKHGLGFLGCGVILPKSEFSAPLLFPHLGFLHRIGEHPFGNFFQKSKFLISGSRWPETGSTYFRPVFFVDDEVETKLEGLEGLGYRRRWKEKCRRFFEIIIGFAQVNQCCCF
jgi:hypothetical protein